MSTILIAHPPGAVRELLHIVLDLAGHESLDSDTPGASDRSDLEALVVDPAWPSGLACAQQLRRSHPDLPIVCVSIHSPSEDAKALEPVSYLLMPFRLAELEQAVRLALAARA